MLNWGRFKKRPKVTEGTIAKLAAAHALVEHQAQRREVEAVASSLKGLRVRNHFSQQIREMIEGKDE